MLRSAFTFVFVMAAFAEMAVADTLVLVQGYLGNAGSWRSTGITRVLQQSGWQDGGHMSRQRRGIVNWKIRHTAEKQSKNRFYSIDLPTEAPISIQARFLSEYLIKLQRYHKNEALIIGAHSAGGVVARAVMVANKTLKIKTLITIASPHRGTKSAETGLQVGQSPIGWFTPMVGGGTINRSQGLYSQLVRERPGTYLGWLNRQPHPKARYVSIIRAAGDKWVPAWSQDMNSVVALAGKSEVYSVSGSHKLNIYDGVTIVNLLAKKQAAK